MAAAILHASSLTNVSGALTRTTLNEFLTTALKVVWLMIAWHYVVLASMALIAVFGLTRPAKVILILIGILVGLDAVVLVASLGWFEGGTLLAIAAALLVGGALVFPRKVVPGGAETA